MATYHRRSARILLVDGTDRVLLLRSAPNSVEPTHCWITPGGGVGARETLAVAAVREAREEIGLRVAESDLGDPVAWGSGRVPALPEAGVFRDDYFHLRVDAHEVDISAMEDFEASNHQGHRWWTVAELESTSERVIPFGLAGLVTDLIAGRVPATAVRLPWHH